MLLSADSLFILSILSLLLVGRLHSRVALPKLASKPTHIPMALREWRKQRLAVPFYSFQPPGNRVRVPGWAAS